MQRRATLIKIVFIGDPACGKTQLINNYAKKAFSLHYKSELGVDFQIFEVVREKHEIVLQTWHLNEKDWAGSAFIRGTDAFILTIDLTQPQALESADEWIKLLKEKATINPLTPIFLVGTKADLIKERQVSKKAIQKFQKQHQIHSYVETSAKDGTGVKEVFETATNLGMEKIQKDEEEESLKTQLEEQTLEVKNIEPKLKGKLDKKLQNYIKRIESYRASSHEPINFLAGLWSLFGIFYTRQSQAFNREANYTLAKALQKKLARGKDIHTLFSKVETKREKIITEMKKQDPKNPHYIDRGINSKELNRIIKKARTLK